MYNVFLGTRTRRDYFLCNDVIYVTSADLKYDTDNKPIFDTMELKELFKVKLKKEYPQKIDDIEFKQIISSTDYTANDFLYWVDMPCDLNYKIDNPYYEVIKFLNSYTQETFKTERYLFYSKKDNDYNFTNNFYAYDLKNQAELKLYVPYKWNEEEQEEISPQKLNDIAVEDLSEKLSAYQQRQCKKAFLKIANKENEYFKTENYWVMELVKQAIQPVLILHEWSCHRCFTKPKLFGHIWVYDFPKVDEEASFMIIDNSFTKVAVLKFKSAEYLFKGMYKRDMAKAKCWELNEQEIKKLIEFLNSPSDRTEKNETGRYYQGYKKYVKTNWQQLIFEYNHNTAYWDIDEPIMEKVNGEIEQLPFDLPIPDYTKLR